MDLALTNLYYGKDRTPASALSGPGASPLPGTIAQATGPRDSSSSAFPNGAATRWWSSSAYARDAPTIFFEGNL